MVYEFKEKITYKEYLEFVKNYNYLSYIQEDEWAKVKKIKNRLIAAVLSNNKVVALANIFINKKKNGNELFISGGYMMDMTNKELVAFMTNNIKLLARKYNAYIINLYPNVSKENKDYVTINNILLNNGYKYEDSYIDNSINILIPLKNNNKRITKKELKDKYDNEDFYLKRGLSFITTDNIDDIKVLDNIINYNYYDNEAIYNLFYYFKGRIKLILAKLDLVYYKHYLTENNYNEDEINKIEELILAVGDEYYIGCGIAILPCNKKNNYIELIYNEVIESFDDLNIMDGIIYETLKLSNENKTDYIKVSNPNIDISIYSKYNGRLIRYIGHYYLVLNKFKYFINKEIKKGR